MNFAHLHVHTEYSLLDGSNKIKEYVARVKELGMTAAAITDHGVMYGAVAFYKAAASLTSTEQQERQELILYWDVKSMWHRDPDSIKQP